MLNKLVIMGRLTADPTVRITNNSKTVCNFTVAVQRDRPDPETGEKPADFFRCVAFNNTAEFIHRYFNKGRYILIDGRMQFDKYTDKEGAERMSSEVLVRDAFFCGDNRPVSRGVDVPYSAPGEMAELHDVNDFDADLPFDQPSQEELPF